MGGKQFALVRYGMRDFWRAVLRLRRPRRIVECMTGSGSVAACLAQLVQELGIECQIVANDGHPASVCLLRSTAAGWDPPDVLTETEYRRLQALARETAATCPACSWRPSVPGETPPALPHTCAAASDPLVGFAGFLVSFGGKYFAGYGGRTRTRDAGRAKPWSQVECSANALRKIRPHLARVTWHTGDYRTLPARVGVYGGDLWYADKPYTGTEQYAGVPGNGCACCAGKGGKAPVFCDRVFWAWAHGLAVHRGNDPYAETGVDMLVSEFTAPPPWLPVWSVTRRQEMRDGQNGSGQTGVTDTVFALPALAEVLAAGGVK